MYSPRFCFICIYVSLAVLKKLNKSNKRNISSRLIETNSFLLGWRRSDLMSVSINHFYKQWKITVNYI